MSEQVRIFSANKTQHMPRLMHRDSVLSFHPFEQARLQRAPQSIVEVPIQDFTLVFNPPSNHDGSMAAPLLDRLYYPAHRLHRHALAKEFLLGISEGLHLEVIPEKGEARRDVVPLEYINVDDLLLFFVDGQAHLTHPLSQTSSDSKRHAHP